MSMSASAGHARNRTAALVVSIVLVVLSLGGIVGATVAAANTNPYATLTGGNFGGVNGNQGAFPSGRPSMNPSRMPSGVPTDWFPTQGAGNANTNRGGMGQAAFNRGWGWNAWEVGLLAVSCLVLGAAGTLLVTTLISRRTASLPVAVVGPDGRLYAVVQNQAAAPGTAPAAPAGTAAPAPTPGTPYVPEADLSTPVPPTPAVPTD